MPLSDEQQTAKDMALSNKISILHGPPGTGKTYTLKDILHDLQAEGNMMSLAAPTGKAAKRMSESTGFPSSTIHKMLKPIMTGKGFKFGHNEIDPLSDDYIIIDESSMITNQLLSDILRALNNKTRILFVGDNYQLPSVGAGAVLRDMIESDVIPTTELTEIQRNSGDIVKACHAIKDGKIYTPSAKIDLDKGHNLRHLEVDDPEQILSVIDKIYDRMANDGYDTAWDVQTLSPVNDKGPLSCKGSNELLQNKLNPMNDPIPNMPWRIGDKIINTKNKKVTNGMNKDTGKMGVFLVNGDMGEIVGLTENKKQIICKFFDPERTATLPIGKKNNLLHAYCITTHRFQGSECPVVIIPLHSSISYLIDRCWLYTSISRGKEIVITVGQFDVAKRAVGKVANLQRRTKLKELIQDEFYGSI